MEITTLATGSSIYPWGDWLDGRCWYIRARLDYGCFDNSIRGQAHAWARKYGVAMTTREVTGGVLIQAYPLDSTWKPNLNAITEGTIRKVVDNPR